MTTSPRSAAAVSYTHLDVYKRQPSGKVKPALASELKALHDFEEDLKEGLGLETLYNEALGTVSTYYLYDLSLIHI